MYKSLFLLSVFTLSSCTWFNVFSDEKYSQRIAINMQPQSDYARWHAELLRIKNVNEKTKFQFNLDKKEKLSSRLVNLNFPNNSNIFKPTPSEEMALLPYIDKIKHIEIRSQNYYLNSYEESEKIALNRALLVKQYLVDHGVDASAISIHYAVNNNPAMDENLYDKNGLLVLQLIYE